LSHNDYFSFQKLYWQSVDLADKENSFNRLLMDAETIFGQEDIERCTSAINQNREKEFLQYFWNSINPQKLSDINFRLVEHYKRLQYAENNYRLRMIGTRFQKSIDTNYMLSFRSLTNNFSPRDLFHKSRGKTLDTRGLLYLRFGPPDNLIIGHPENNPRMLRGTSITYNEKLMNKMEIWWYGRVPFIFEEYPFAGGFIYRTLDWPGIALGDINKAMDRQLYEDTTIVEQDDYYVVQFKDTTNYGIEVTILQEQPQGPQIRPLARAAIFDTLWQELVRFDSPVYPVNNRGDSNWLAVHSLSCLPGMQKYYFEMKSDCKSWVGGGELDLIAFKKDSLQISGIVLGIDPDENKECFNRCGVDFIPRPSFVFSRGEKVRVYLEYYNLKLAADSIGRYKEYIDVVRIEGESGILGRIKNVMTEWLSFGEQKGGTSITLAFGRESNRDFKDRAVESFILETDQLQSGKYRLLVEAYDLTSGCWDNEGVVFEIKAE